ncbi:serine/threonine protein kinase [Pontibacter sp. HJ8]|jgi:serine/threonine-protein kinase RsbW
MNQVKIQIPSLIENIRVIESFIDNSKEEFEFEDDVYGNIMVAVTESVNNAIRHGNKFDKEKIVYLTLQVENNQLLFEVEDEGPGFDYDSLPDPTAPENLESPGGRGIFLMRNLCDEVNFLDNGKKVQLVFNIASLENGSAN